MFLCSFLNGCLTLPSSEPHLKTKITLGDLVARCYCSILYFSKQCFLTLVPQFWRGDGGGCLWFLPPHPLPHWSSLQSTIKAKTTLRTMSPLLPQTSKKQQCLIPLLVNAFSTLALLLAIALLARTCNLNTSKCPTSHFKDQYSTSTYQRGKKKKHQFFGTIQSFPTHFALEYLLTVKDHESSHHLL